jgi:DNA/RNA endonuclease YhcR with UshA esterase domain
MSTAGRRRSAGVVIVLLLLGFLGVAVPAAAATKAIPIATARTLPLGTVVTVDGSATTPSGVYESSSFDKGFAIQDRTAGIYVSVAVDKHITPRTQVRVTGELQDSFGQLILVVADPASIRTHGKGPKIHPQPVATGAVGEATEGSLVKVVATVTQAPVQDPPFGAFFHLDDGSGDLTIFVTTQTGIDLSGLAVGQTVRVTGLSSQFDTHYEILPRSPADLVVLD